MAKIVLKTGKPGEPITIDVGYSFSKFVSWSESFTYLDTYCFYCVAVVLLQRF